MRLFFIRWLLGLLERSVGTAYTGIDDKARKEWLTHNYREAGFISYFKWRDLTLLKNLGTGMENKAYWVAVGQRMELLTLVGLMKDEFDRMDKKKKPKEETKEGK